MYLPACHIQRNNRLLERSELAQNSDKFVQSHCKMDHLQQRLWVHMQSAGALAAGEFQIPCNMIWRCHFLIQKADYGNSIIDQRRTEWRR